MSKSIKLPIGQSSEIGENDKTDDSQYQTTDIKLEVKKVLASLNAQGILLKSLVEENKKLKLEIESLLDRTSNVNNEILDTDLQDENIEVEFDEGDPNRSTIPDQNLELEMSDDDTNEEESVKISSPNLEGVNQIPNWVPSQPLTLTYDPLQVKPQSDLPSDDFLPLIHEFNNSVVNLDEETSFLGLIEASAAEFIDRPAIVHNNQFLTFQELNQQANQMARYLGARGCKEEEIIGISIDRSIDMIISMLAVLKIGCTFVLIDEEEKPKRLKFIALNSDLNAVITTSEQNKKFNSLNKNDLKIINLDQEKGEMSDMEPNNLHIERSPHTPIYIVYSSSPVKPTGIPIFQKTLLNELNWQWRTFAFKSGEACCQIAKCNRIEFFVEIFSPLIKGIPNVIIPDNVLYNPNKFTDFLAINHISRIQIPPTILATLLTYIPNLGEKIPELKSWFLRGELVTSELVDKFKDSVPNRSLTSLYNVTEAGGVVAYADLLNDFALSDGANLGVPIDNVQIYFLDEDGKEVSAGQTGEISISSFATETWYLKNPVLSQSSYIQDELTPKLEEGRFIFKTGDFGRLTTEGQLQFLGRLDQKIKYYGQEIDPVDLAWILQKQSEVIRATVIHSTNNLGQLQLKAFMVMNEQTYPLSTWRKYMLNHVPNSMLPTQIYQIKSADTASVAAIAQNNFDQIILQLDQQQDTSESPKARDTIESALISIWQSILGSQNVSINDDFFELGGSHIQAELLPSKLEEKFKVPVPNGILYRHPTISDLAVVLREAIRFKEKEDAITNEDFIESFTQRIRVLSKEAILDRNKVIEIQTGIPDLPKFFCVHGENGDIAYLRYWIKYLNNQPFYSFQPQTIVDGKKEEFKSIEEIASDYIREMQKLQPKGPFFLGGYSSGGVIAYEMAQQLLRVGETVGSLVLIDTINPILNRTTPSFSNRFESLAAAPAAYFNKSLFKKLTERNFGSESETKMSNGTETVISPKFRQAYYEKELNELINKYQIKPYTGSILLIASTETSASINYASIDRGWNGYALSLKIHEIQGEQGSLIKEPNSRKVIRALQAYLNLNSKKTTRMARVA